MGEMKAIRWGIWGTGAIAHSLVADFPFVKGAVVQAVASRTGQHAQRFATRYGVPKSYTGIEPLLNDPEVDVIYVATPNSRHMQDSVACMEAGKAVLCEKPFALNLTEAQGIVGTARQRKVFCMEAMWTRFIPAVIEVKRAIDSGVIGPVCLMQGNFAYPVPAGVESRFFDANAGGGALLDRGVYLISLAQHLLGAPESISGSAYLGSTGVDEQSAYQLVHKGGALADFAASLRTRGTNEVTISGERGVIRMGEPFYRAHRIVTQSFATPQANVGVEPPAGGLKNSPSIKALRRRLSPLLEMLQRGRVQTFPFPGNGYQFELQHVTDCLREQRLESAIMPLSDSLEVMRTMDVLRAQMYTQNAIQPMREI